MNANQHTGRPYRVTLTEVAKEAGVSRNVASLIMNRRTHPVIRYSDDTAERVRTTAARLGYRPNRASRAHFGGNQGSIGVLVDDLFALRRDSFAAMVDEAADRDQLLVIERLPQDGAALPAVIRQKVIDGLLVASDLPEASIQAIQAAGIPVVWINTRQGQLRESVMNDEAGGMALAVDHLLRNGRRRLLHINLQRPSQIWWKTRNEAFLRAAKEGDATSAEILPWFEPAPRQPDGEHHYRNAEVLAPLLAERPQINGITVDCFNAIAVYRALRKLGRRVPNDVAVVGFNNMEAVASHIDPALTTVGIWGPELGRSAVRLLNDVMAGRDPAPVLVPCRLFERLSVRVQESAPFA